MMSVASIAVVVVVVISPVTMSVLVVSTVVVTVPSVASYFVVVVTISPVFGSGGVVTVSDGRIPIVPPSGGGGGAGGGGGLVPPPLGSIDGSGEPTPSGSVTPNMVRENAIDAPVRLRASTRYDPRGRNTCPVLSRPVRLNS